jgi:outer membrane receptor protein involved in Fe transport
VGFSQRGLIYDLFASAAVEEQALGVYSSVHSQWTAWFASIAGLRYQTIDVVVADKLDATAGGRDREALLSPKLSLRFGPFASTEFFINYGEGFHSNDARGVVRKASAVPLMSESVGYELGMRSLLANDIQLSVVAFRLDLDSELVFVGDESTTEPRDASRRQGLEVSVFYQPMDWFVLDMDFASSETEFKQLQVDEGQVLGKYVPDSVEQVFAMGASIDLDNGVYAGLRLRYFGPRKLTEGGDVESAASKSLNANIGYRFSNGISLGLEVINALDERDDDITYYYASRTLSERSASIEPQLDMHAHPMEPRTYRGTLAYHF